MEASRLMKRTERVPSRSAALRRAKRRPVGDLLRLDPFQGGLQRGSKFHRLLRLAAEVNRGCDSSLAYSISKRVPSAGPFETGSLTPGSPRKRESESSGAKDREYTEPHSRATLRCSIRECRLRRNSLPEKRIYDEGQETLSWPESLAPVAAVFAADTKGVADGT